VVSRQRQHGRRCRPTLAEHRHVGVPEAVDRLELVPDHEQVAFPSVAEEVEQLGLQPVRVLELVDHDRGEALPLALADLRVVAEQVARLELEVLEVERRLSALGLRVRGGERRQELLEQGPVARRKILERRRDSGVARLANARRAGPAAFSSAARGAAREASTPTRSSAAWRGATLELGRAASRRGTSAASRSPSSAFRGRRARPARARGPARPSGASRTPRRASGAVRRAVGREQLPAVGLVGRAEPLERRREGLAWSTSAWGSSSTRKRDRPRGERMRAEQPSAEAVDRRDPRAVELEREVRAPPLEQPFANPPPQLPRGALGIGDHEERLDVEAVVDDGADEPLDEHCGLARTRARCDEHAPCRLDRGALLLVRGGPHARSLRQIRQRSHQCGQSPPCGSWRTSPPRIRSTSPTAVPRPGRSPRRTRRARGSRAR
jgi:hypothetical protein